MGGAEPIHSGCSKKVCRVENNLLKTPASNAHLYFQAALFNFKTYATYCVPVIENRADVMLKNANAMLRSVHHQVWQHVALLLPQPVFESFFVWFARSQIPVLH
ncbi:hypothetical protein TNCV_1032461 [Trichonephila clavipes]|nr:hypothetical protein TNCV_1032461 [Trichonephila clavipes]